jgi:hypothetical protein
MTKHTSSIPILLLLVVPLLVVVLTEKKATLVEGCFGATPAPGGGGKREKNKQRIN